MLLVIIIIIIIISAQKRKIIIWTWSTKWVRNYRCVRFVNLSVSSLGVCSDECSLFLDMMNDIGIDKKHQLYVIKKMINIAIRATYYIFCCRNRNWDSPDLMQFWFLFFSFFLFFFFLIIQSQATFVNCLYIARFTKFVHSKTQIKFPLFYYYYYCFIVFDFIATVDEWCRPSWFSLFYMVFEKINPGNWANQFFFI